MKHEDKSNTLEMTVGRREESGQDDTKWVGRGNRWSCHQKKVKDLFERAQPRRPSPLAQ